MAGHSKWSQIKRKKGALDQKRGALFSKLSRAITVAARQGVADPEHNAALAQAVQAAKDASMPKDNIERAIQKAAGGSEADAYEAVTYEGYGPGGVAVIVETLTDNRNRTAAEVRYAFSRSGGTLGTSGCVAWQFHRGGNLLLESSADEEEALLVAADAGADDVSRTEEGVLVRCEPTELMRVRAAFEQAGFDVLRSDFSLEAQSTVELDEQSARATLRLMEALEDLDDVQSVSANFDIPDRVLEAVAGEQG